jgi:hypothetical protein
MNKAIRIILSGVISAIVIYFAYTIFITFKYSHSAELFNSGRYIWMFNDSVQRNIDSTYCFGEVRESDILYSYNISQKYFVSIWEFKEIKVRDVQAIPFIPNVQLDNLVWTTSERLHINYYAANTVKSKLPFGDFITVNFNKKTKVEKQITGKNLKGFYGTIDKLSLQNREGENLILFDYQGQIRPTLFLLYKLHSSFFIITVNSHPNIQFDDSIIKILNLEEK